MSAPSIHEINKPRKHSGRDEKKNPAKSGGGIKGFFDKFRGKHTLDEDIAAVALSNGETYVFNFDEVIKLLPIEQNQKVSILADFTTSSRQVQEYLVIQIEKRFMDFVHEYIDFKFNQLLIKKTVHGRKIDNVQRVAEEETIKDFTLILADCVDYSTLIQPFLKRHEQGSAPYDLQQVEEALLAQLRQEQGKKNQ